MAIHLLIIARKRRFLDPFRTAFQRAQEVPDDFYVRTCPSPSRFLATVREVVISAGQPIGTLDIFGHGGPGLQKLGKKALFHAIHADEGPRLVAGKRAAEGLRPFLAKNARLRLLGCKTACEQAGSALLLTLHELLGSSVVVYGTIAYADAKLRGPHRDGGEFGERGFKVVKEDDWLFSSTEAREGKLAPDQATRMAENQCWMSRIEQG